jgi:hypothetical protein
MDFRNQAITEKRWTTEKKKPQAVKAEAVQFQAALSVINRLVYVAVGSSGALEAQGPVEIAPGLAHNDNRNDVANITLHKKNRNYQGL